MRPCCGGCRAQRDAEIGGGPSDRLIDYLLWKQSLDPTRFARYHPGLGPALHKIAITQIRLGAPGRTYYQRRIDSGDNGPTALRCLKRKIARVVYRCLLADVRSPNRQPTTSVET